MWGPSSLGGAGPFPTRRQYLAGCGLAGTVGLAGCFDRLTGGETGTQLSELIPPMTDVLAGVDPAVAGVPASHDAITEGNDRDADDSDMADSADSGDGSEDIRSGLAGTTLDGFDLHGALLLAESVTGRDLGDSRAVVVFGSRPGDGEPADDLGVLLDVDWSPAEVADDVAERTDTAYDQVDEEGERYEPSVPASLESVDLPDETQVLEEGFDGDGSVTPALSSLGSDLLAIGSMAAVEAALDVAHGGDGLEGSIPTAYGDPDTGLIRYAQTTETGIVPDDFDVPSLIDLGPLEAVETIGGTLSAEADDDVSLEVRLYSGQDGDPETLETVTNGALSILAGTGQYEGEPLQDGLERATVDRDDEVVFVRYAGEAAPAFALIEEF